MKKWLNDLDQVLRGEATRIAALRKETIEIHASGLTVVGIVLAALYGVCMGGFAVLHPDGAGWIQMLASAVKVPALFFLTVAVTFPSLYVFNALVGSRLSILSVFRLLVASLAVNLAVLASLGPIVAFFSLSTTSYTFMVLLDVLVFAVSGALGLTFLLQTLHRLSIAAREPPPPVPLECAQAPDTGPADARVMEEPGPLDRLKGHIFGEQVKTVFYCWMVIFGLVGAQMGWILRPFIGSPGTRFTWLRERESNFFEAVFQTLMSLFS